MATDWATIYNPAKQDSLDFHEKVPTGAVWQTKTNIFWQGEPLMSVTRRELIRGTLLTGAAGFGLQVSRKVLAGKRPPQGKSILLQIYFKVAKERVSDFEKMFAESYVPALRKQHGYIRSALLRLFPENISKEIEATATAAGPEDLPRTDALSRVTN